MGGACPGGALGPELAVALSLDVSLYLTKRQL